MLAVGRFVLELEINWTRDLSVKTPLASSVCFVCSYNYYVYRCAHVILQTAVLPALSKDGRQSMAHLDAKKKKKKKRSMLWVYLLQLSVVYLGSEEGRKGVGGGAGSIWDAIQAVKWRPVILCEY